MEHTHSLQNTVIAVFDRGVDAEEAIARLRGAGYEVEILQGASGTEHIDPKGEEGFWAALKRVGSALGDEKRVLERLNAELSGGNVVLSVDITDREAKDAISIMRDQGGRYLWRFGGWTFTPIEI